MGILYKISGRDNLRIASQFSASFNQERRDQGHIKKHQSGYKWNAYLRVYNRGLNSQKQMICLVTLHKCRHNWPFVLYYVHYHLWIPIPLRGVYTLLKLHGNSPLQIAIGQICKSTTLHRFCTDVHPYPLTQIISVMTMMGATIRIYIIIFDDNTSVSVNALDEDL